MKRLAILLAISFVPLASFAQVEATQYFMNSLPQVSINNPAFIPKYKVSVGLPLISSFAVNYSNNGFTYNDITTKSNGETKADLNKWTSALASKNYITNSLQTDIIRVGVKINQKLYIQLNSSAKGYTRLLIPKELSSLLVQGTGPLVGTSTGFSPQAEGLAYVEIGVGGAYKVDDKLTVGARFKYLEGILNVTTVSSNMNIAVGNNYQFTAAGDLNVKTSGVYDISNSGYSFSKEKYTSNTGMGVDLGATYKITEKLTVAASISDLGKITWKNNNYGYTLDKATANYTFAGIDANKLVQGNTQYLNTQWDSIKTKFELQKKPIGSYSTWLPGKIFMSGNYEVMKNLNVGALLFAEKFQGRFAPGFSGSLIKHFGKWISTSVSYTVTNRSYNNLGAGLSFNLAPFQFYMVGDNLLRAPISLLANQNLNSYLNSSKVINVRAGINIVWGWDKGNGKAKAYDPKKDNGNLSKIRKRTH